MQMGAKSVIIIVLSLGLLAAGAFIALPARQSPQPSPHSAVGAGSSAPAAPTLVSPADGSPFVSSDFTLEWAWSPGLAQNQFYAVRIWEAAAAANELWTEASSVNMKALIDSLSLHVGELYWQVSVIAVDADGAYAGMISDWSQVFTLRRLRRLPLAASKYEDMSPAARHFYALGLGNSALIDAVHRFIQKNSVDSEQLSYAPDYSDALQQMYKHSLDSNAEPPRLLCDGRSTVMLTLLKELGIESRLVFLYQDLPGWLNQHTVLEVFNPDSQYWQTHDLASGVYYAHGPSGIRVNAESILFDDRDDIWGCPVDGGSCSAEAAQFGLPYFEALRYGYTQEVWVNPDRFDLSARFTQQGYGTLAEYIGGRSPQLVIFRLDSLFKPRA